MNRDEAQISLMSWNINGLKSKVAYITNVQEIINGEVDIVFLQETHIGPKDTGVFDTLEEWYTFFTEHLPSNKGVAILIKKDIAFEFIEFDKDSCGRYIIIKCIIQDQVYTLVNVYNHEKDKDILDELIPYLQESAEGVLVIGGDFNTTLNLYLDRKSTEKSDRHAALRKQVEKFTASLGLVDVWRRINRTKIQYTYSQNDSKSRLDYIFMQEEAMWRVKTCEIHDTVEDSDHKPVCLQLTSTPSKNLKTNELMKADFLNPILDFSYGKDRVKSVDIAVAAQSLPNPKHPGPNGIPICSYKSNSSHLSHYLKVLFNKILDSRIDDVVQMSFNGSIPSLDDTSYHFFNSDYLVFAAMLARPLEKHFKDMTVQAEKRKNEIEGLIVFHLEIEQKVRWPLLEEAIKERSRKDPLLNSTIVDKLLRRSDQDQDQEFIQLRRGCPLTPALLKLYVTHFMSKVQTDELFPSGMTVGTLIYGEQVMMSLSLKANEKLTVKQSFLEETRRERKDLISAIFDKLQGESNQDEDKDEDEHKDKDEHEDEYMHEDDYRDVDEYMHEDDYRDVDEYMHEDEEEDEHEDEDQDPDKEHLQLRSESPDALVLLTLCVTLLMSKVQTHGRFFPTSMIIRNLTDSETVMISVSFK